MPPQAIFYKGASQCPFPQRLEAFDKLLVDVYAVKTTAEYVIQNITYESQAAFESTDPPVRVEVAVLKRQLERYLRGTGHPDCPFVKGLVSNQVAFNMAREDPTLRARYFLIAATGRKYSRSDQTCQVRR
jgi:hypothetical protein